MDAQEVPVVRSWADELEEMLRRDRERVSPPAPRGELEVEALERQLRELNAELYRARNRARLLQEDVAASMGTTKSAVSRLETSIRHAPSLSTILRYARAVGCELEVRLVPPASSHQVGANTR